MKVLFHLTVPPSPMATCDAVVQEVELLHRHVPHSAINHLYPGHTPGTRLPRVWWGLNQLVALRRAEQHVDLHHVFNPDPFPFAVLRFLRKPVLYTAVAGLSHSGRSTVHKLAQQVRTIIVPTPVDRKQLQAWQITNSTTIGPLIDVSRFTYTPPAPEAPFTLMIGSAPWTREQFNGKGVTALLEAAQRHPQLRLIFLWRGILYEEMMQRVAAASLQERVQVLNRQVNVNELLARVHASVVLADSTALIKAYPHSLLESLAAGKPVLVSRLIPMAQWVVDTGCGRIVDAVDADHILAAVDALQQNYASYQQATQTSTHGKQDTTLQAYLSLYEATLS